jgi:hypothetical protein
MRFSAVVCLSLSTILGQEPTPPVYFNHTTIYLSPETYEAIRQSAFLRDELSYFPERTVQRDGGEWSYTGLYANAFHTYLEFFKSGPGGRRGLVTPAGKVSLGMWIDNRLNLPTMRERLGAPRVIIARDGQNNPTFDLVRSRPLTPEGATVDAWVMARYPDGTTRETEPRAANYLPARLFHDVIGFRISVSEAEREQLVHDFRAFGYAVRMEGNSVIASGPEITITLLRLLPGVPRNFAVEMSLNGEKTGEQRNKFGSSELQFEGRRAVWTFTFPPPGQ